MKFFPSIGIQCFLQGVLEQRFQKDFLGFSPCFELISHEVAE